MTREAFRRDARAVADWIADYTQRVENLPVLSQVKPGEIRGRLPDSAPQQGEPFEDVLRDVEQIILPGITHWQSPNFFAFFPANASGPSILGEMLSAGLAVQGMMWTTSPACTELETHVLDWLVTMLDLPEAFRSTAAGGGVIQDTASTATLCALLAARERATGFESNRAGLTRRLVAYASSQAHSLVEKAVMIAGLGRENLRLIECDERFAMRPERLQEAIDKDRSSGGVPCFVCATVGTTSSHALDPLGPIGEICRTHGLWLHVDAWRVPTATASTRTSGCSPTSTVTASGLPTGRRSSGRWTCCPNT
jgi:aromatic-L-amino-acid decarboxylase